MTGPGEDDDYFDTLNDESDRTDCDHVDAEIGWEGRAVCICGHSWWASAEEIEAQDRHMREYAEWEYGQARRYNVWWRRLGRWLYHHLPRFTSQQIPF